MIDIKLNKAILVIDMPCSCATCDIRFTDEYSDWCPVNIEENQTDVFNHANNFTKPDWCPLKPLPEKLEGDNSIKYQWGDYEDGWNHCINSLIDE